MAHGFNKLKKKMKPESIKKAEAKAKEMMTEMSGGSNAVLCNKMEIEQDMTKNNNNNITENQNRDNITKVYEQAIDAHKSSIKYLLLALGILSGVQIYQAWRNDQEYKQALDDIKEYRDEARSFVDEKIKHEGQSVIQNIQNKGTEAINTLEVKSQEGLKKLENQIGEQNELINLWMYSIIDENKDAKLSYLESLEKKKPNDWIIYYAKGSIYYEKYSKLEETGKGSEQIKRELLIKTKENAIKSYNIKTGFSIGYIIIACSLLDQEEECQKWLERNFKDKSLPYQVVVDNYQAWTALQKYESKDWYKKIVNEWQKMGNSTTDK